jgi:hypothetical protein
MPREIGWSVESNLLYQIKQLIRLVGSRSFQQTFVNYASFPVPGTAGVTYIDGSTGVSYIWNGSSYVPTANLMSFSNFPINVVNNGVYKPSQTFTYIPPSTYLATIYSHPYINKSYPDANTSLVAISNLNLPGYSSTADTTVTSVVVEDIELATSTQSGIFGSSVTSVTYQDLKYLMSNITLPTNATLTSINFPQLLFTGGTFATGAGSGATSLSFPKLEVMQGTFTNNNTAQSSLSFPELLRMSGFIDSINSAMTSYSFPKLKIIEGVFTISGTKSSLTSISFGALEIMTSTFTMPTTSTSLTLFTFGVPLKIFASNFVTTSNSLNQASVDNILIRLAALDGTGGTIAYSSRTVTITGGAATPSAAGLAAKAVLVARGCTVTNN